MIWALGGAVLVTCEVVAWLTDGLLVSHWRGWRGRARDAFWVGLWVHLRLEARRSRAR